MIGFVYQEPMKIPMRPLGGRARQKRNIAGRSVSSSVAESSANVWM